MLAWISRRSTVIVVALGVLFSLAMTAAWPTPTGVYWARAELTFLAPAATTKNPLGPPTEDLVSFATAVERQFNGAPDLAPTASTDAPLFGRGVRVGYSVRMPNTGSQWRPSYSTPVLVVEATSRDEADTQAIMENVVSALRAIAIERQERAGVRPSMTIEVSLNPASPQVTYITGSSKRSAGAVLLVGLLVTFGCAMLTESRRRRRSTQAEVTVCASIPVDVEPNSRW